MNINQLFNQFVGGNAGDQPANMSGQNGQTQSAGVSDVLAKFTQGPAGGLAGGLAAGGLLGALIGNKKMRKKAAKFAGGAVGYGGSAVLGAVALKAYQNWQSGSSQSANLQPDQASVSAPARFDPEQTSDATGQPMQLALIKAMIAAANADGHIDQHEQAIVFDAVDKISLDSASKALVFDVLRNPPTISEVASFATGLEQASEIYLASRLAIDPDETSERRYLDDLATAMGLPNALKEEIEMQVDPDRLVTSAKPKQQFGRHSGASAALQHAHSEARRSG